MWSTDSLNSQEWATVSTNPSSRRPFGDHDTVESASTVPSLPDNNNNNSNVFWQDPVNALWQSVSWRSLDQMVSETAALVFSSEPNNTTRSTGHNHHLLPYGNRSMASSSFTATTATITTREGESRQTPQRQGLQQRQSDSADMATPQGNIVDSSVASLVTKQANDDDNTASTTLSSSSRKAAESSRRLSRFYRKHKTRAKAQPRVPVVDAVPSQKERPHIVVAELAIDGMVCTMCSTAVENCLLRNKALAPPADDDEHSRMMIRAVQVSLVTDMARVQLDARQAVQQFGSIPAAVQAMVDEIHACGFDATVTRMPSAYQELDQEQGPYQGHGASKESSPRERAERLAQRQAKDLQLKRRAFLWSLLGTGPILMITMVFNYLPTDMEAHHFWKQMIVPGLSREALALWILCTPVQFVSGWPFYKGAYRGVTAARSNGGRMVLGMDALIVIGTTAAYVYAVIMVVQGMVEKTMNHHGSHFFETSAVLITFVLLGKWLQALAVRKTSTVLMNLMQLQGNTAVLVAPQLSLDGSLMKTDEERKARVQEFIQAGEVPSKSKSLDMIGLERVGGFDPAVDPFEEAVVPLDNVKEGDFLKVVRGASIPADGKIVHGEICVDESMITGESLPVLKTMGKDVLGGTVCNEGTAFMIVTGAGNDTALSKIVRLVEDAQMTRAPIQDFADRVSGVFVPAICSIALVSFVVWLSLCYAHVVPESWFDGESELEFSLLFGIAVLVISCPCALGLAAPTAIMVGTGVGASHGILIKGGEQLQSASSVSSVIFDKTGTLTVGKPSVTNFIRLKGSSLGRDYLLWLVMCAENNSEHPLAKAIVKFAEEQLRSSYLAAHQRMQPTEFVATTGRGIECTVDGRRVKIGNSSFVLSNGLVQVQNTAPAMRRLQDNGRTAILIAVDEQVVAVVGVADEIKKESACTINRMKAMGIEVWMVTGDNRRTALAVSKKLGLSSEFVIAEALPVTKVEKVRDLQSKGHCVAMIGDGINDSIALAQADVGIAIGTSDIAAEAADLVLVKGAIFDTVVAFELSRKIFNRIKLNFVWALVYNCLGIPVAAGVFYPLVQERLPPTLAAAAMALSSICVVLSSLSLRWTFTPSRVKY